jgi:hypothetical protein
MSWYTDAPEDEAISLFAGLLANPDVPLSHILWRIGQLHCGDTLMRLAQQFYVCMLADWKIGK